MVPTRRLLTDFKRLFKRKTEKPAPPSLRELGASGTSLFSGQIWEELLPELSGPTRMEVYERMRSDAQVAAVLNVIELPIRAADFAVEPFDDTPPPAKPPTLSMTRCAAWTTRLTTFCASRF